MSFKHISRRGFPYLALLHLYNEQIWIWSNLNYCALMAIPLTLALLSSASLCPKKALCKDSKHSLSGWPEPGMPTLQHCSCSMHWLQREHPLPPWSPPAWQKEDMWVKSMQFSLKPAGVSLAENTTSKEHWCSWPMPTAFNVLFFNQQNSFFKQNPMWWPNV